MQRPELISGTPIEVYRLLLGTHQDHFLYAGAVSVVGKLFCPVIGFGGRRKDFNNKAGMVNDIYVTLLLIARIAAYRNVGIDIARCGDADTHIRVEDLAGLVL